MLCQFLDGCHMHKQGKVCPKLHPVWTFNAKVCGFHLKGKCLRDQKCRGMNHISLEEAKLCYDNAEDWKDAFDKTKNLKLIELYGANKEDNS